jgi:type I restriction enzyme S subunit
MILAHTVPVAVLGVNAAINQDMKALMPNAIIEPEYLCSILWALNGEMLALIDRSKHDTRKLNTAKLLAFRIPVPPREEQRRIVAYLDDLDARFDRLKALQAQVRAELDALLPSILDRAFEAICERSAS